MAFIDWIEEDNKDTFAAFFVLEAMSAHGINSFGTFDSSKIDFRMIVNGVEIDSQKVFDVINKQMEEYEKTIKEQMLVEAKRELFYTLESKLPSLLGIDENDL